MEYCKGCPGYGVDARGICKFCGKPVRTPASSSSPLGEVNLFELAKLLSEKRERERRNQIPPYSDCPRGHNNALLYDGVSDNFTCKVCGYVIVSGTLEYKTIVSREQYLLDIHQEEPKIKQPDKSNLFDNIIWPGDSPKSL
jgi:hypothetical protein